MRMIINDLLAPLIRRIGSMAATALVAQGVSEGQAASIEEAFVVLMLIGLDLVHSAAARRIKP